MPASGVESFATRVVESEFVAKISSAYRLPDAGAARQKGPQVQVRSGCAARAECISTWIGVLRVLRVLRVLPSAVALAASSRVEPSLSTAVFVLGTAVFLLGWAKTLLLQRQRCD